MTSTARRFDVTLEPDAEGLGWTVARVPFDPAKALPEKIRHRVCGTVNGVPFRTSLFPHRSGVFVLLVTRATLEATGLAIGGVADIVLNADLEPRPAELPDDLAMLLDDEPGLRDWYDRLSESNRREVGKWCLDARSDEARLRRAQAMAERLLSTMNAERELPPAIVTALRARPRAREGWQQLTETQRRNELFGVFYYQSPEAKARRIAKLCDNAEARLNRRKASEET